MNADERTGPAPQPDIPKWDSLVDRMMLLGLTAVAIRNEPELVREGAIMMHSAGEYAPPCIRGTSRIFSVRHGNQRIATMEICLENGRWRLAQVSGPLNRQPGRRVRDLAEAVARAYNRAWKWQNRDQPQETP